jgi:hypothetical protein
MSSSELLPILIPFGSAIVIISMLSVGCARRQMNTRYTSLEQCIYRLEQKEKLNVQPKPSLDPIPVAVPQQNLNTYPIYPNYQPPSAPYAIQQPYSQYPPAAQSYAI